MIITNDICKFVKNTDYIALKIFDVIIGFILVSETYNFTVGRVDEFHPIGAVILSEKNISAVIIFGCRGW